MENYKEHSEVEGAEQNHFQLFACGTRLYEFVTECQNFKTER